MKYFKSKTFNEGPEFEVKAFVAPEDVNDILYDRIDGIEYHGIDTETTEEEILSMQHPECEVESLSFEEVLPVLKGCRFYKEIDTWVVDEIRRQYSIDRELEIMKLDPACSDYIDMMNYIAVCRQAGNDQKTRLGLKE